MIRYGLLGGSLPKAPWQIFVVLGGACLAAGVLFSLLFPDWSSYFVAGVAETIVYVAAGSGLLVAGVARRRRSLRQG